MVFRDKNEFLILLSKYRSQKQKTQKRVKNKDRGGKMPWFYCSFNFFSRQKEKNQINRKERINLIYCFLFYCFRKSSQLHFLVKNKDRGGKVLRFYCSFAKSIHRNTKIIGKKLCHTILVVRILRYSHVTKVFYRFFYTILCIFHKHSHACLAYHA